MPSKTQHKRLSSRYLLLSLAVALVPLFIFAGLYDRYFDQLVSKITDGRINTQVAAVQNEFRVHLRERLYQLDVLADELDSPEIFQKDGKQNLPEELEALLRLQTDLNNVYGIAFFDAEKQFLWSFPEYAYSSARYHAVQPYKTQFEQADIFGPEEFTFDRPSSVLLVKPIIGLSGNHKAPYLGLILRFNSLAAIPKSLGTDGIFTPYLGVPGDRIFDIVGQPAQSIDQYDQTFDLFPGWSIKLRQNEVLAAPPSATLRYWLIGLVMLTAACLLVVHWFISKRLNRQVDTLIAGIERVASGDLKSPVPPQPGTEVERLTIAIEKMRSQLNQVIQTNVEMERRASLGNLAAGLAHDIRNPLNIVGITTKALLKREFSDEKKEMLSMVTDELGRVNRVIDNLLNFARPAPPKQENVVLIKELNLVANLLNATLHKHKVSLHIECEETLELFADPTHLHQVLINLVLNAIQSFNGQGGDVTINVKREPEELIITVIDNGPGIDSTHLERIFEPFYTTKSTGTGLGLAICQALIQANHGRIEIHSDSEGTTVFLKFPIQAKLDDTYE
ncbi:ATP-binding protein [Marinomonas ostreistagni]|uniref:histidine kinase n=1 Tax=Marinomonas ostreistagni TaxID=359209 RepID=A0ABS0Z8W5_9GAMM|nr:ATP-binding protein [Marinomonas ostreistagni]MBJ7549653.1 HAMP domain-containing protein [Marinomonas ostreistagni]